MLPQNFPMNGGYATTLFRFKIFVVTIRSDRCLAQNYPLLIDMSGPPLLKLMKLRTFENFNLKWRPSLKDADTIQYHIIPLVKTRVINPQLFNVLV